MASGDTMFKFTPQHNEPPATNAAIPDRFAAVTGNRPVLDFIGSGGSVDEVAIFSDYFPSNYDGGGVDVVLDYSMDAADTEEVNWEVSIESLQDGDDQDAGGADFGTATDILDTPGTPVANKLYRTAAGAISHANCGSPAVGDRMRLKVARDHDHATNVDDAQLHGVYATET